MTVFYREGSPVGGPFILGGIPVLATKTLTNENSPVFVSLNYEKP
jgi:hypothetical protein